MSESFIRCVSVGAVLALLLIGNGPGIAGGLVELEFDAANFSNPLDISNPYWPLIPGTGFRYFAESEDECEVTEILVTLSVKPILGVDTRVVEELAWIDEDCDGYGDILVEETYDWYAQDNSGNIWYMGEWTTSFFDEDGNPVISHEGSWEAGQQGAEAGILMLAAPAPGLFYRQEYLDDEAEDMGKVLRLNASVDTIFGELGGCLVTKEWTRLAHGEIEHKYYCPGLGLVLVEELKSKTTLVELVEVTP